MSKGFRVALGVWLLALGLAAGVEWTSQDQNAARRSRERRAIDAGEPSRSSSRLRRSSERSAPLAPPSKPDSPASGREAAREEKAGADEPEAIEAKQPEKEKMVVDSASAEYGTTTERDARALERKHDGDLGRATLKSGHLRDRTRKSLGGRDLGDISVALSPGRPLGEATLHAGLLRDRTRESLGGADLRDLGGAEPGNLGRRSLKSGHLRDLSRGADDYGDLADRSGR